MPEYSIGFSERLLESAKAIFPARRGSPDARRVVVYQSRLATEIALKSLLESGGMPIKDIRKLSHNLREILDRIEAGFELTHDQYIQAASIRALTVNDGTRKSTVGAFIQAENYGDSGYPVEIRYGNKVVDVRPETALAASEKIVSWISNNSAY